VTRSRVDSATARRSTHVALSVNSFHRTIDAARTRWCELSLNAAAEQTNAGRRFAASQSENGNGTTTASQGAIDRHRLPHRVRTPIACQRGLELLQLDVGRQGASYPHAVALDDELDAVTGAEGECVAHGARDRGLILGRERGHGHGAPPQRVTNGIRISAMVL